MVKLLMPKFELAVAQRCFHRKLLPSVTFGQSTCVEQSQGDCLPSILAFSRFALISLFATARYNSEQSTNAALNYTDCLPSILAFSRFALISLFATARYNAEQSTNAALNYTDCPPSFLLSAI